MKGKRVVGLEDINFRPYFEMMRSKLCTERLASLLDLADHSIETVKLILNYCDNKINPPQSLIVDLQTTVERIELEMLSLVKELSPSTTDVEEFKKEFTEKTKKVRQGLMELAKRRFSWDTVADILTPTLALIRAFLLSVFDELYRKTAERQEVWFVAEVMKRVGIEPTFAEEELEEYKKEFEEEGS